MLDPRRLRQLLEGLLGAMIDGDVSIRTHCRDGWLRFDITSGGSPSDLTAESSGIIGQRIVDAMRGRLGGDTADPWFELPIEEPPDNWNADQASDAAPGSIMLSVRGRPPHILVAEDIETNRIVICSILEGLGCTYATVADGEAAVAAVAGGKFDAVLMDVMMPVMDGAEATQRIRALTGGMAHVPIIGVTAHSLQLERDALLARGMNACLTKPVDRDAIHGVLAPLLDGGMDSGSTIEADVFAAAFAPLPPHRREALLALALDDVRRLGDELAAAAGDSDADAISRARAAHSLKGVAGNFGFTAIIAALAEMSATGRQTRLPAAVADVLAEARQVFDQRGLQNG
jgi:CheY-like chemotaxis protein